MHSYTSLAAKCYAAYRPPLHSEILKDALSGRQFRNALDIGCGVGHSSEALLPFCDKVVGLDPSPQMISSARKNPRIAYRLGHAGTLPTGEAAFDCVSMAGALPYIDQPALAAQLRPVCTPSAMVVVYDFKVALDKILTRLGLPDAPSNEAYDHAANLSDTVGFETLKKNSKQVSFPIAPVDLTYLLLANEGRAKRVADHLNQEDPTEVLIRRIVNDAPSLTLNAMTWYALHRLT